MLKALVLFCLVRLAHAATYYVSSSGGNDANSGLSPAAAWRSLDMISLRYPVKPGDEFLLKRGDTWDGQITLSVHGTAAAPVKFGSYGAGAKPIIYSDSHLRAWAPVAGSPGVFSASLGYAVSPIAAYEGATALALVGDVSVLTPGTWAYSIGNLTTTASVYTATGAAPTNVKIFHSQAVEIINSSYLVISGLDIRRSGYVGINLEGNTSNVTISGNSISDVLGIGVYVNGMGAAVSNVTVTGNSITRTGNDALYTLMASGSVFSHNTVSHVTNLVLEIPTSGDQCGIGLQQSTGTVVEHNSISSVVGTCFDYFYESGSKVRYNFCRSNGRGGATPHGTGLEVYYNVFSLSGRGVGINAVNTGASPNLIYNNTIYQTAGYGLYGGDSLSDGGTGANVWRNNLIVAASGDLVERGDKANESGLSVSSDYNLYYTAGAQLYSNLGNIYTLFSDYQKYSGELHSLFALPDFVSARPARATDFKVTSASPAWRSGENMQSAGFVGILDRYVDYSGVAIPPGTQPNRGAFQ